MIFSEDKIWLKKIPVVVKFLNELKLELYPNKVLITTPASEADFLSWINLFDHRVLRIKTKKRIIKKLRAKRKDLQNGIITKESF